jgi:cyclic pyranopterin phosphate synthase
MAIDRFGRRIHYLRISLTDHCNLRCIYCMPEEGIPQVNHTDILSYEEILLVVRAAVQLGIDKIRITGGEPLVRADVTGLVEMIASIEGVKDISMTTNGILLGEYAGKLRSAGLNRINISLDTLRVGRFRQITRTGELAEVLKGIEAAARAGLTPVKINMVPMQGVNDDEIIDFARMTVEPGWHVRFIEMMPLNRSAEFVPTHVLRERIKTLGALIPFTGLAGNGAARYYSLPGARGTIGFISPVSEPFCKKCNRLRLSATGTLFPCLFSKHGVDLRDALRGSASTGKIRKLLLDAIASKPEHHQLAMGDTAGRQMSGIGG